MTNKKLTPRYAIRKTCVDCVNGVSTCHVRLSGKRYEHPMNATLSLVENKKVTGIQPAVMRERDAIKYISLNRTDFRELVNSGAIPYFHHLGKPSRIYFKEDLDDYLRSIRCKMPSSENPLSSLKGAEK